MRKLRHPTSKKTSPKKKSGEPLTEGLQKKRREPRNWISLSDGEIISFAKKLIQDNEIKSRTGLQKADVGLYEVLRKRNLIDMVIQKQYKNWSSMTDEDIIIYAKTFIKENKIKKINDLQKVDFNLYNVLRRRNLLDAIFPNKQEKRNWASMTDEGLMEFAKKLIQDNEIKSRTGLQKADVGLYEVLRKRNLIDAIISQERRSWSSMSDEEIISYAKTHIEENGIKSRNVLFKANCSLYIILRKRNLLEVIIPKKKYRCWSSMSDEELASHAKKYIEEKRIKNRKGLVKADSGLHGALVKRKLLDTVFPNKMFRYWSSMSDEELTSYAKNYIEENTIKNRKSLKKADNGLYIALKRRKLLNLVVPRIRKKGRNWLSMTDQEVISYARNFIQDNGIKNRSGLQKADGSLYNTLRKRNLLGAVFSNIEQTKRVEAVRSVVKAMEDFDGGSE